jgi:methyl-accepting chemotaxis protein
MSIKVKLVLSFSIIFIFWAGTFGYQYIAGQKQLEQVKEIEEKTLKSALLADDMKLAVVEVQQWLTDISATRGLDGLDDGFELAETYAVQFYKDLDELAGIHPEQREKLEEIRASFAAYYDMGKKMAEDYIEGGTERGNQTMGKFDYTSTDINNRINQFRTEQISNITNSIENIEQTNKKSIQNLLISSIAVIAVSMAIAMILSWTLTRSLNRLIVNAEAIADGDLTREVKAASKGEIGRLSLAFERMRVNLSSLIVKVQQTTDHLAEATAQLSSGVDLTTASTEKAVENIQQISVGVSNQLQSTEEIARAVEEMALEIGRIAETAGVVSEAAKSTEKEAVQGNDSIVAAIRKMESIRDAVDRSAEIVQQLGEHSKNINQIIEVMGAITSQTHLLALNASIEAAHAGEQGRGFMVVAGEVRKLADQAKDSADQISEMIKKVQTDTLRAVEAMKLGTQEVASGTEIVLNAGQAFDRILKASVQVADQIVEVSAASEELTASAQQVASSTGELARIAKQSSSQSEMALSFAEEQFATIQDIASFAQTVHNLSQNLVVETRKFKTA